MIYISIIFGASLGAILRYSISNLLSNLQLLGVPISILLINVVGSFLLGIFFQYNQQNDLNEILKSFISIGLLSSFTTFSTFSLEAINLFLNDKILEGIVYILASVILSIIFLYLGILLIKSN